MLRWTRFALVVAVIPATLAAQNPPPTPPPTLPVVTPTQQTPAQAAAQAATGQAVSNDRIADAIRNSGMNQSQIQAQLRAAGYDPALADPFFSGGGRGGAAGAAGGAASNDFAQALQRLGILSTPTSETLTEETTQRSAEGAANRVGGVFGKDIFARSATVFDPVTAGPVDPAYRLGVGDQLQLVVTGQVELAYALELRRDGTVIVPQVGQISLAGMTIDAARTLLKDRMGRSYSGLNSGEARLDLSLARIRSNAVFVIGEAEQPGSYQVNALATVFHALARAGGPTERGSFRAIEVRRGGRVVQRLDLYDYLLRGDAAGDIRLEQGDQIFVPLNTRVVAVTGQVRRPRIFELREAEGFSDLLNFAGGLLPNASVERVQIDRILPADQRRPGFERVKVDIEVKGRLDSLARVRLLDGDIVQVFSIGEVRRNVVNVSGQVFQPGEFELRPAMTLGRLLDDAQGLLPWALSDRIKVVRQLPLTGRSIVHNIDASTPAGRNFLLEEFDAVEVLDGRVAFAAGQIFVEGAVNAPSTRPFSERETLRDAIERSGGVREGAEKAVVYRRRVSADYSDTTSVSFTFPISANFARDTSLRSFFLERDDRVVVLASAGFRDQQFVTVRGQFRFPGTYAIAENVDRIRDIVQRAGDVLPGAYPGGFHLVRRARRQSVDGPERLLRDTVLDVSVDFSRAMRGDAQHNLPLLAGDTLVIDRDPNTVLVTGAVSRPALVKFERGRSVADYIDLAGGATEQGNRRKAVVQYPSGVSRPVKRVALLFHTSPEVVSGSTINIPEKPADTTSSADMWQRVFASASALASLVLAYSAVTR